jgi:signal transduction histidine kinase
MFGLGEGLAGGSLIGGEPTFSSDVANDPRFVEGRGKVKIGSMACMPMVVNGTSLGVINLSHPDKGVISAENIPVLSLLAGYLAVAVSNALLLVQLRNANDELQTTVNRRTRSLEDANQKLKAAQEKIADHNEQLQQRVDERTKEVRQTMEELHLRSESLERANRIKDEFLNNINHELKTPLNAIIGYSGLLKREVSTVLSASQLSDLELIEANGKHLQQIIDNILALKAIEGGDIKPDLESTDLIELLRVATASVAPRARAKAVGMSYEAGSERLPNVNIDATLVRRVVYNLLDNAVKFSAQGEITVRASILEQSEDTPAHVLVAIQDEGKGIRPEDVDRIFDKFQQAEPAMQKHEGGSGVGLTIAKTLVELHGGRLKYTPGPKGGSIFSFTLPLA